MCGILCIISYGGTIDQSQYSQCLKMLKPRGPDNERVMVYNDNSNVNVYMGFQRLAIMDTSDAGLQPFDANQTHVICNGEIYGYKQLVERHNIQMQTVCDCELILPLYRKVGFLNLITKKLDAEFAMVLYDEQKKVIYAARDRYGVRPLFYG